MRDKFLIAQYQRLIKVPMIKDGFQTSLNDRKHQELVYSFQINLHVLYDGASLTRGFLVLGGAMDLNSSFFVGFFSTSTSGTKQDWSKAHVTSELRAVGASTAQLGPNRTRF